MGSMQALERLWDRPAVRWPLALAAVLVLVAGIRMAYAQNHHAAHVTIVPGGGKLGLATFGHPISFRSRPSTPPARSSTQPSSGRTSMRGGASRLRRSHGGLTHAQWMTGSIPVSPFPRDAFGDTRYKVEWSRSKNVMLLALITPDKPGVKSGEFFIEMVPQGRTLAGRLLRPARHEPTVPAAEPCTSSMATTDAIRSAILPGGAALAATAGGDGESGAVEARGYWEKAFRRLRRDRLAILSGVVIMMFILVAFVGAPLAVRWVGHGPNDIVTGGVDQLRARRAPVDRQRRSRRRRRTSCSAPPTWSAATSSCGCSPGRRCRSRWGSCRTIVGLALGLVSGLLAGFYGGLTDTLVSRLTEIVMAFPLLLFLIALGGDGRRPAQPDHARRDSEPGGVHAHHGDRALHVVLPGPDRARAGAVAAREGVRRGGTHGRARATSASCARTSCRTWSARSSSTGRSPSRSTSCSSRRCRSSGSASRRRTRAGGTCSTRPSQFYTIQPWLIVWPGLATARSDPRIQPARRRSARRARSSRDAVAALSNFRVASGVLAGSAAGGRGRTRPCSENNSGDLDEETTWTVADAGGSYRRRCAARCCGLREQQQQQQRCR